MEGGYAASGRSSMYLCMLKVVFFLKESRRFKVMTWGVEE
jgi:hypothetical protein